MAWFHLTQHDITTDDSTMGYSNLGAELEQYMESVKSDTHRIDLKPYDISRDKQELWAEQREELRESRHKSAKVIGGVALTGTSGIAALQHVRSTPIDKLFSSDSGPQLIQSFANTIWNEFTGTIAIFVAFVYSLVHGLAYLNTRQRALALRAKEILDKDKRRPVLMIRSFRDDKARIYNVTTAMRRGDDGKQRSITQLSSSRFEEALTPEISKYGPLIAVGSPREELPELGAARARFSNDNWREPVIQMLDQSRVILLVSGTKPGTPEEHTEALLRGDLLSVLDLTPGVRWEVDRILGSDLRYKLLVILRPTQLDSSQQSQIEKAFDMEGDIEDILFSSPRTDPGLIHLEDLVGLHVGRDGSIAVVQSRKRIDTTEDYALAIRILLHSMLYGAGRPPAGAAA